MKRMRFRSGFRQKVNVVSIVQSSCIMDGHKFVVLTNRTELVVSHVWKREITSLGNNVHTNTQVEHSNVDSKGIERCHK